MKRGLNKAMIIGRLGKDPETRLTPSGKPISTFSVAVDRGYPLSNREHRTEKERFNVVAWGHLAEVAHKFLKKGTQVFVEGHMQTRRWQDSEGTKYVHIEIVANELMVLTDKPGKNSVNEEDLGDELGF